jgi:ferredoxin
VERACGAGGDCGTCRPEIERVLERVMVGAHGEPGPVLPVLAVLRG